MPSNCGQIYPHESQCNSQRLILPHRTQVVKDCPDLKCKKNIFYLVRRIKDNVYVYTFRLESRSCLDLEI